MMRWSYSGSSGALRSSSDEEGDQANGCRRRYLPGPTDFALLWGEGVRDDAQIELGPPYR